MEILKDKKVIIGGLVIIGVVAYFYFDKKKKEKNALLSSTSGTSNGEMAAKNNYPVSLSGDTQGNVWIIIDGKKYGVGGTQALIDYGVDPLKYPYIVLSKGDLDAIPTGGSIGEKGIITKN